MDSKIKVEPNIPHSYGAETVISSESCGQDSPTSFANHMTFAHVLDVPASEEVWPGDAIMLFFPQLFAMRMVGFDEVYEFSGLVWQHMRDEVIRLCDCHAGSPVEDSWHVDLRVYCYEDDEQTFIDCAPNLFSDDCDDDDEEDTLNSELLLTEECIIPDSVQPTDISVCNAQRRVSLTERKG